ncbi:18687_t:CDS:1, partial [Dentiscutata erythropus]
ITSSDIDKSKLETASDDLSAYYRKVAREYGIPLSRLILLTNYKYAKHRVPDSYNSHRMPYSARSPLCEYAFYLSVNNFRHVEDPA